MATISLDLSGIVNGLTNDATDVSTALSTLETLVNGQLDINNLKGSAGLLTATSHGAVSGGTGLHPATAVSIADSAGIYTGINVETALAEIGAFVGKNTSGTTVKGIKFLGYDMKATYTDVSVAVDANSVSSTGTIYIVCGGKLLTSATYSGGTPAVSTYVPLALNGTQMADVSDTDILAHRRFRMIQVLAGSLGGTIATDVCMVTGFNDTYMTDNTNLDTIAFNAINTFTFGTLWTVTTSSNTVTFTDAWILAIGIG